MATRVISGLFERIQTFSSRKVPAEAGCLKLTNPPQGLLITRVTYSILQNSEFHCVLFILFSAFLEEVVSSTKDKWTFAKDVDLSKLPKSLSQNSAKEETILVSCVRLKAKMCV